MTIHKSQGSEFNQVVLFLPEIESSKMASLVSRELLYTGLTRAKDGCLILCSEKQFRWVVNNQSPRFSGLKDAIATGQTAK